MKSAIVALCVVACAYAVVVDEAAQIVRSVNEASPDGKFSYGFESDNGISAQASGSLKPIDKDTVAQDVTGSFSYVADGKTYSVSYVANENGFQAQGEHLPTPPPPVPIPEYIVRALEYIAAHPYQELKKN